AKAVEATGPVADSDAVRAAVATATDQRVPFPDDAVWIEVRVVDKASGEAVPDATVTWTDQTTQERITKDTSLSPEDRNWLRRDQEKQSLLYGWQATSDSKGMVRVHLTEQTFVIARHEKRYGTLQLQKNTVPPKDGYRVELEPDIEVLVQVLDAHGQPAVGVPIGVTQNDAQGTLVQMWRWEPIAITRAPDGIAVLRHMQDVRAEAKRDGNVFAQWRTRTFLPGYEDPGVVFSIDAPTSEPIVLRLPPCGSVRVRAELHGAPLALVKTIRLAERRNNANERGGMQMWMMQRASRTRPTDEQGWARFDHMPLGATYQATANVMSGYMTKEFKGPMTQDQEVTVLLAVGDDQMLLTGRLVDEQQAVLADREFTLNVRGQWNEQGTTFRSDAQGRFLVFLGQFDKDRQQRGRPGMDMEMGPGGGAPRVVIVLRQPGLLLQADLSKREFRAGLQDAGDVVMKPGALVVAGRLVTGDGPCKLPVQPAVERHEVVQGRPEPRWRAQRDFQYVKGEDGHFEYRGDAAPGRYRLRFNSNNHLPVEPIEFAIGTKDLVVRIDTGAALAASVLLPKDSPDGLRAVLTAEGAAPKPFDAQSWRQGSDRLATQPWSREEGRYQLQWGSIPPGTYTLDLQLWGGNSPLLTIGSVVVPPPQGGDSRLVDIDLRSLVRIATIRLFDDSGKPLDNYGGVFFLAGQDAEKEWLGYDVQGPETKLLLRPQPLDLLVGKRGYRPLMIQCAGAVTDAKLDPWPTVDLLFDGLPELPKDVTLSARLAPRDQRDAKYRSMWDEGDRTELLGAPRSSTKVEHGRARVPIGDGPHDAKVSVGSQRRSVGVELARGEPVLPDTQRFGVVVPTAALQQALDKLKAESNPK
ncbi:MAG: hypothetical protein Q7T30_04345, partial [Planctomycetota bacterium]|nr:hypothetical protein [Planctomycetota bacterium]